MAVQSNDALPTRDCNVARSFRKTQTATPGTNSTYTQRKLRPQPQPVPSVSSPPPSLPLNRRPKLTIRTDVPQILLPIVLTRR